MIQKDIEMTPFMNVFSSYITTWYVALNYDDQLSSKGSEIEKLATELYRCWAEERQVFLCGNGGSAANALHIANDLIYPVAKMNRGLRAVALTTNPAVLTCIANDESYEQIFSIQLFAQAQPGDVLIVLSGSGNSPNILAALKQAKTMQLTSYAILGFDGGKAKQLADHSIHVAIADMQIAEDMQLVIGHIITRWLAQNNPYTESNT
jgi:D-sedoheptulose 7-phosphate isomerase